MKPKINKVGTVLACHLVEVEAETCFKIFMVDVGKRGLIKSRRRIMFKKNTMMKRPLRAFAVAVAGMTALLGGAGSGNAALIGSFENGEVFDGRAGPLDGVGDELFDGISSYFNTLTQGVYSGQAMAYFDISSIDNVRVTSATFSWDVNFAFGSGAPDSTSIYGMPNDPGLSLDDFDKGPLIGTVATTGFDTGSIITIDVKSFLRSFSGNFVGIRLASNDPASGERFLNMENGRARLDITVPEPATLSLFGLGLAGLGLARRRKQKAA